MTLVAHRTATTLPSSQARSKQARDRLLPCRTRIGWDVLVLVCDGSSLSEVKDWVAALIAAGPPPEVGLGRVAL